MSAPMEEDLQAARLFWRYGLEAAILSRFAIDVVVHFLRPLAESWLG